MLRIGLTGGIGSGKSTVLHMLSRLGAGTVDADAISRSLTAPGGAAMPRIAQVFGPQFVAPDGSLDRALMREHVFANPHAKQQLEAILHPLVRDESQEQAQAHVREGRACIAFDIPLLIESDQWRGQLDRILVIDCPPETQIQRVMTRSSLARSEVEAIIAAQAPRNLRLAAADIVICNDGLSLDQLAREVEQAAKTFGL